MSSEMKHVDYVNPHAIIVEHLVILGKNIISLLQVSFGKILVLFIG